MFLFFLRNAMSLRVKYSVICLLKSSNGLIFTMAMTMKNCHTCLMFCYQNSVSVSNIYVQTVIQKCGQRNRRSSNRQTDKQTDGQTSGRTDEQVYGQTDTTTMHLTLNLSSFRAETNSSDFKEINLIKKYTKLKQILNRAWKYIMINEKVNWKLTKLIYLPQKSYLQAVILTADLSTLTKTHCIKNVIVIYGRYGTE